MSISSRSRTALAAAVLSLGLYALTDVPNAAALLDEAAAAAPQAGEPDMLRAVLLLQDGAADAALAALGRALGKAPDANYGDGNLNCTLDARAEATLRARRRCLPAAACCLGKGETTAWLRVIA
ncbi:hypothetical protein CKO31_11365 [Thiohalocapsa halophila]|uniref:Tetratricopeptide repeat protein n=1 Tax=Thiohalocapsa halophila TaxID=69359 RepID=A0ABS1CHC7_9GAMM|nr:hypothetical protein [Thiohalocapsa halophila]MBK1631326.1 hypothetical protein [Thiohalocapsa halophila]